MPLLEVEDVHVAYGGVPALKGVSLSVERGEIVALIGANGAGKTTLLRAVAGLEPTVAGRIRFDGVELRGQSPQAVVRRGLSLVPQQRGLFPHMTVAENLRLGGFVVGDRQKAAAHEAQVLGWFPILAERARQRARDLSGGEQQMLAIGRALMGRPALLMLDEPSLALAPKVVETIARIIAELRAAGTTILLVEQNVRMALAVADRAYVLARGSVAAHAPARELGAGEQVLRIYFGQSAGV